MAARSVGRRRLRLVTTVVVSPLLFFALLELVLRGSGFGSSYPLFVDAEGAPGYLQANPRVIQRYFPGQVTKLAINPIYFRQQKPPGSYRIVVQGGSSAAGFPYGRWAGLAGMLGDRLEAAFPEREIEVITTAMSAVNSYTLLDFVDEIVAIEPDAVLIYAGHNEYLGIFGVGSALTAARSRAATLAHLQLGRLRISQYVQQLIAGVRRLGSSEVGSDGRAHDTLMARAAASARIPFRSLTYEAGARQFEANLDRILQRYREAGVPVYLGTLASNEKDQPPFASGVQEPVDREQWEALWRVYQRDERAGKTDSAREALSALLDLDADSAAVWYELGRLEYAAGSVGAAREAFRNAKDRDELRFRAPESFNRLIRQLASRQHATLVDVQQHLAAESRDGVFGEDLFVDHLHPNAEGYFLLADAYYEAMKGNGVLGVLGVKGEEPQAPSRDQAMRDMPITAVDRMLADQLVRELKADFPFSEKRHRIDFPNPSNEIERLAQKLHTGELSWLDGMDGLLQIYLDEGRSEEAAVVARVAAQAHPNEHAPNFSAGRLLMQLRQFARARRYLDRSLAAQPDHAPTLAALVNTNLALEDRERAGTHLASLKRVAPSHPLLRRVALQRARRVPGGRTGAGSGPRALPTAPKSGR